ncbi:MAG: hypothetical protein FJY99_03830 [Candidatus Sericytochromatia bacterium]|nr:hypothetical protein [Candidatus Tanganyikabacteria bacterium]
MPAFPIITGWLTNLPFLRKERVPRQANQPSLPPMRQDVVRLSTKEGLREQLQRQLDQEIGGANQASIKTLVRKRPDLVDAASPDQRAQLIGALLGRNGNSPDREGIGLVMTPSVGKGEDGVLSEALARVGKRAALFRAMGDLGPGLDVARFALKAGWFEDLEAVADAGLPGVKAAMRVATDQDLTGLPTVSKSKMIAILQDAPYSDENDLMVMRIRRFMEP